MITSLSKIVVICSTVETEPAEKQSKHSDRSSNDSDLKVEIRTASSLSNMHEPGDSEPGGWEERSETATPRLANGGDELYRYSADYTEPFPPKTVRYPPQKHKPSIY